jgi:transposase-like protein
MAKQQTRRKRRAFPPEFKAEAVRLCRVGDRTVKQVAADLDLTETALRDWVKRAEAQGVGATTEALATDERDELRELRKRVKRLEMEREILKKAAAFFAKENG